MTELPHSAGAVKRNNDGVAFMNQQLTERALDAFREAYRQDPTLTAAKLNEGISLLYLQKLPEAEAALQQAIAQDPRNPRGWYNLGLAQRAGNDTADALASFAKVLALDPGDADSYYFEAVCHQELQQNQKAIPILEKALAIDPNHASSEFALARSLQREGKREEAALHFKRFQHLTSAKISSALGLTYGDQGRYSTVEPVAEPTAPTTSRIPIQFVAQPILAGKAKLPATPSGMATGGSCWLRMAPDGDAALVLMRTGQQAIAVWQSQGNGGFQELRPEQTGIQAGGTAISCAAGDFDGDGRSDLAVALTDRVLLFHNDGGGRFHDVTAAAGLVGKNRPQGITFVDYDHDGDLDLLITGAPPAPKDAGSAASTSNVLWRNNGNQTFTDWTEPSGLGGSGKTTSVMLTDFNNDRAVDLLVAGDGATPTMYANPREGKYPPMPLYSDKLPASRGLAVLDFNKDGWMDVAVTHDGAPGLTLWRNVEGKRFERMTLPFWPDVTRAWGVTPIDFDNDGWIDLAVVVETGKGTGVKLLRNRGDGSFADGTAAVGLDKVVLKAARGLIAADVDGDGAADLVAVQQGAEPVLLHNVGGNKNHSIRIQLIGFADNKTAIGAKVEVYADGLWQKWEIVGGSGYLSQGPAEILAGLGKDDHIDLLRMLWPTGVFQDEIDVPRKSRVAYKETDRRGSSCPVLFAWNGHHYGLVTDAIGAGVVGHWFSPTRRNIPDPDEWIKVDGGQLQPVDGRLSLRFAEPMEEVNYIDQLRLVAIDHPDDVEVNPDERFLDDPPFASGKPVAGRGARPPVGAWDSHGRDALARLTARDHQFASDFTALPYDGFANRHALTLDLGQWSAANPLRLLLTGYVEYFSASSLYAASQAGIAPVSPYIEEQLPGGGWRRVVADMGFPAGLERTIVADLTGKLTAGTRRIRIVTNLRIYWDQILVENGGDRTAHIRQTEVPLLAAKLRFHGYPLQIEGKSPGDLNYDYDRVSLTGPFQRQRGNYTRYGDISPLITGLDNRFAIFGSGEEIATEFDATALPALPARWKRDYFFYANGYVKDMDYYDASPFTVGQMPFHGMSAYPYPDNESFPDNAGSLEYQLNWNDRFDSGAPHHSFRFEYRDLPSTPADSVPDLGPAAGRSGSGGGGGH